MGRGYLGEDPKNPIPPPTQENSLRWGGGLGSPGDNNSPLSLPLLYRWEGNRGEGIDRGRGRGYGGRAGNLTIDLPLPHAIKIQGIS